MAKDSPMDEAPDLVAEITALRKEFEALATTVGRIGRAGVAGARDAAKERFGEGANALESVEGRILSEARLRPWRTLGIAALGGLVLGMILRR